MQPDIFWSPKTVGRVLGYITAISFQLTMQSFLSVKIVNIAHDSHKLLPI